MKITLVRHGQTEENYSGKIQGMLNSCLSDTGRRQCQKLRQKLGQFSFDVCYMSPLLRTVETAMILIGDRVEMVPDKRIIERDMGELEGKDRSYYDVYKYWNYEINCGDLGIEKVQDIFIRCQDFLEYIIKKHAGGHVLVVTHGAPFRALRHLLLQHPLKGSLLDAMIDNCYYQEFVIDEEHFIGKIKNDDMIKPQ